MNVERPLPLAERYLQSEVSRDATGVSATLTYLAPKNPEVHVRYYNDSTGAPTRREPQIYLEHLEPDVYAGHYRKIVELNAVDEAQGAPAPPLNERAHLSVLILDLDDGNHKSHDVVLLGRLIQHALALHFGVRSAFLVSLRRKDDMNRYHMHFPGVLMLDMRLWGAIKSIVYRTARQFDIDTSPLKNRCMRVHGTNRDHGLSEPTGVYKFVVGYTAEFTRMTDLPRGDWFSVRPAAGVLAEWMRARDPRSFYRACTVIGEKAYLEPQAGASIALSLFTACTREFRQPEMIVNDRSGRWFLIECRTHCNAHRDTCRCRVLCRVTDGATVTVHRWLLCVDGGLFCALEAVQVVRDDGGEATHKWPRFVVENAPSVSRIDSIMTMPLESFYEMSINGRVRMERFSVIEFASLWRVHARHALYQVTHTASTQRLTVDDCTYQDPLLGHDSVRVAQGIVLPQVPAGTHLLVTLAAPCGSGKTFFVFSQIALAAKTLLVAPLKSLTRELAMRVRAGVPNKHVVHYKDDVHGPNDDLGDVFIVTPESLWRFVGRFNADLLVIDEFCTVTKTVYTSSTTEQHRREIEMALLSVIAKTAKCIVMDRDIGPIERMVLGSVLAYAPTVFWPPERNNGVAPDFHVHSITLRDWMRIQVVYHDTVAATLCSVRESLVADQRVALFSATASLAFAIAEMFRHEFRTKLVAGPIDEADKADFAAQPDAVLAREDTQLLVYTTAAGVGISIERHPFDHVYVILGRHLTLRHAMQAERRVRRLVDQDRNERVFHLCPGDVRSHGYTLRSMPTIGDAVAMEQTRTSSGLHVRSNVHAFDIDGAPQLTESMPEILQIGITAALEHERHLQGVVVDQWLRDVGADIHSMCEEDYDEDDVATMRSDLRDCKRIAKTDREALDVLGDNDHADTRRAKISRVASMVPPQMDEIGARNLALTRWTMAYGPRSCRIWAGMLLPADEVVDVDLQQSVADSLQIGLPGTGVAPMSLFALACLRFVGGDRILQGVACVPHYDHSARVISPFDGTSHLDAQAFFSQLALMGRPSLSANAAFHGDRSQSLVRNIAAYTEEGMNFMEVVQARLVYCRQTAQKLLGGKHIWSAPECMLWCTANYLDHNNIQHTINIGGDPWGMFNN